ncbi:maltose permease Mal31p [Trichomonascus vanleenenianus]|uniref:maltose permease Mal31p n=1 Tax=Trichomonascus vanleenenianus TaxID=2268995 RepID=UPI003ECB8BC8
MTSEKAQPTTEIHPQDLNDDLEDWMTKGNVIIVSDKSKEGTALEHQLTLWQAVKKYPKIILWCMFLSLPIIGLQYDETIMGAFYALPAFQKHYGRYYEGKYIVPAKWQSAISMAGYLGQIFGGLGVNTKIMDKYGPRVTLSIGVASIFCTVFLQFFAVSLGMLFVGEFFAGIVSGGFVVIAAAYASEIAPLALRGILTSYINLCAVTGQFIGTGVATALQGRDDQWAYRIPFALQWSWPIVVLSLMRFCPESPYWLVRRGRTEDAEKTLKRLSSDPNFDPAPMVAMMKETNDLEQELNNSASYLDCFRATNLRRTEISMIVFLTQVIGGGSLMGYSTYFFELAGMDTSNAFAMSLGLKGASFCGTVLSWFVMSRVGRRRLYVGGEIILTCTLFIIGILDVQRNYASRPGLSWAQAGLLDLFTLVYDMTIGPICYVLISEVSATRLRGKTISVATANKAVFGIIMSVSMPYMMNADHANWRGKAGFFFGGINTLLTIWCFLRIPETKGRTFEELDILFERGVKARDFSKYTSAQ